MSLDKGSLFYQKRAKEYQDYQKSLEGEFGGFLSIGHFVAAHLEKSLHYEVSNYGRIAKHNLNYWAGGNYLGIGAGAVGCIQNIRTSMPSSIEVFLQQFDEAIEVLDEKDLELEHLFLGFRSCVGVEMTKIPNKQNLAVLLQEKILEQRGNRVFAKDYFLGDEIALFVS